MKSLPRLCALVRFSFPALALAALLSCGKVEDVVIQPAEIDDALVNPDRGFATTHCFNEDIVGRIHPRCSLAQFRWYWDELEPEEGRVNFAMIDSVLARARANGQKLNFRVMCQNGRMGVPQWVRDAGAKGEPYANNPRNWQPHYDDPVFLEKHGNLIRALGRRYDGHPDIDCVDIGTVGRWGEWHTSGTGMEMPSDEVRRKIIDIYLESFRKTPLIMLIGGGSGLAYAVSKGTGWRADCLGDMGGFNPNWNHMQNFYPQALDEAQANDAWQHAPVVFETCWTIQYWHDKGWDLDYILSEALKWHVSVLNNGSESIPEDWWPRVQEFEKKMGYRLALKRLVYPSLVDNRSEVPYEMVWENQGVAPPYHNYPLAFQFRALGGANWIVKTEVDITKWLPGTFTVKGKVRIPDQMPKGKYDLGFALVDSETGEPAIRLANEGRDEDGWYRLGKLETRCPFFGLGGGGGEH